jgi:hypothetical protein
MRVARLVAVVVIMAATVAAGIVQSAAPAGATVVKPFGREYSGRIYGDFLTIGNTVLVCPAGDTKCTEVMERKSSTGNNNDFDMQYADGARALAGYDSSTSRIAIPPGATVAWARLDWGGNTGAYVLGKSRLRRCDASAPANAVPPAGSPESAKILLKVGSQPAGQVDPETVETTPDTESGPHYYTATADVLSALSKAPTGHDVDVSVADLWAPTGYGCVGGWSLTVVYQYPRPNPEYAPSARAVYVYEGHVLQRSNDPATTTGISGFQVGAEGAIRAGVTAYEGDYNVSGSRFAVNGRLIANPDRPDAGTSKFFDSYAAGTVAPDFPNNMSVDAKDFDIPAGIVPLGSTDATLTFSTKGDTYLVQSFAFSVPIPDELITQTPVPAEVGPGQTIDYGITVDNGVDVAEHDAEFTTHLAPVLTDAVYEDARASAGTLHYEAPDLVWKGSLRPGQRVTIDIQVKTITDPRANARLREYIIGEGAIMGCQHGRGPGCSAVTELEKPVTVPCDAVLVGGSAIAAPSMRSGSFTRADGAAAGGARVDLTPQRPGAPAC